MSPSTETALTHLDLWRCVQTSAAYPLSPANWELGASMDCTSCTCHRCSIGLRSRLFFFTSLLTNLKVEATHFKPFVMFLIRVLNSFCTDRTHYCVWVYLAYDIVVHSCQSNISINAKTQGFLAERGLDHHTTSASLQSSHSASSCHLLCR